MFCEASDLVRLPPLSLDPVAEQVHLNSESLTALAATVQGLVGKLSFFLSSFSSTVKNDLVWSPWVTVHPRLEDDSGWDAGVLTERPVQIKDLFRLGKCILSPSSGAHPRLVLIKLATTWDHKVVLLHKRNLQDFRLKHLFWRADVLPEHRLRQRSSIVRAKPPADDLQLLVNSAAASAVLTSLSQSQPSVSTPAPKLSSTVQSSTVYSPSPSYCY